MIVGFVACDLNFSFTPGYFNRPAVEPLNIGHIVCSLYRGVFIQGCPLYRGAFIRRQTTASLHKTMAGLLFHYISSPGKKSSLPTKDKMLTPLFFHPVLSEVVFWEDSKIMDTSCPLGPVLCYFTASSMCVS